MNSDLEKELAGSCPNADRLAYTDLVKVYSGRVFAICLGMLGNTHDAEDIAQQTLLKGFMDINQLRDGGQFGVWISRIAKNLCIDFIRRRKRKQSILRRRTGAGQNDSKGYPELKSALAKLPEEHRLALMLYYFDGRNTKNIAETMTISEAAAQARLSRARKRLRKLLETEGGV